MEKSKSKLWTLIKLRLREVLLGTMMTKRGNTNAKAKTRTPKGVIGLYALIIVSFGFMFSTWFMSLAIVLIPEGFNWVYMAFVSIVEFFMLFLGSVFMAYNQLFEAKDNEQIMSLPISPRDVLASRMISLLAVNYLYALLVGIPAGSVYLGFDGGTLPGIIIYIVLLLFMPFFTMFFSLILGWLIGKVTTRLKRKNMITIVLSVGALLIYFYFIFTLQGRIDSLMDLDVVTNLSNTLKTKVPPAYWFGQAVTEHNIGHALMFIALCIVPFVAAVIVLAKSYGKLVIASKNVARIEYKGGGFKTSSGFMSIVKMELRRFLGSATYMVNGGIGLIFVIMMIVEVLTELRTMINIDDGIIGPSIAIILLFTYGLNCISSATISLEAKTMWILKSTPVETRTALIGKSAPHVIVSLPFIILGGIIANIFFPMTIICRIGIFLVPLMAVIYHALVGVYINLCWPKFNWVNEGQAIKQGLSPLLSMLVNGLASILVVILYMTWVLGSLPPDLFMIPAFILFALLSALVYVTIGSNGRKRWEAL